MEATMLADQLHSDGCPGYPSRRMRPVLQRVQAAQKFVLEPSFAAAADYLSKDYGSLVKAFPFCRLPFRQTWIEVAQHDRPSFVTAGIHAPQLQSTPRRVGFLCSATRDDLSAWTAHLFWNLDGMGCNCAGIAMQFDMTAVTNTDVVDDMKIDSLSDAYPDIFPNAKEAHPGWNQSSASVRQALINHTDPTEPDYGLPYIPDHLLVGTSMEKIREIGDVLAQLARSDWAGEVAFLLAVIGLLNARNTVERAAVSFGKKNKARIKQGKLPLFDHHVLRIHRLQMKRAHSTSAPSATHSALRLHLCSGHWKVRKTGIFFWRPFWRGDPRRGEVGKTYEVV
jgi:hypothetical protein